MLAHQLLQLGGRGIFEWRPALLRLYYRMGSAKIGKGVPIHLEAQLSDFDLITVADNVAIDAALVAAFSYHHALYFFGSFLAICVAGIVQMFILERQPLCGKEVSLKS